MGGRECLRVDTLKFIIDRAAEPSTWAGVGLLANGVALLLVDPTSGAGWANVLGGVGAIFKRERQS